MPFSCIRNTVRWVLDNRGSLGMRFAFHPLPVVEAVQKECVEKVGDRSEGVVV